MRITPVLLAAVLLFSLPSLAAGPQVVSLRKDCPPVPDCNTPTSTTTCFCDAPKLATWLWGGGANDREDPPSANDRVLVYAGPGDFGRFQCSDGSGYVSVIGAGRQHTTFSSTDGASHSSGRCLGGITAQNCEELNFQDLTAYGTHNGVLWMGAGSGTWSDVDLVAGGPAADAVESCGSIGSLTNAWNDGGANGSTQRFFGSRLISQGRKQGGAVYGLLSNTNSSAGLIQFYGGEILAEPSVEEDPYLLQSGISVSKSRLEVYGASIRSRVGVAVSSSFGLGFHGAWVENSAGTFVMHGGLIAADASSSATNVNAMGLRAAGTARTAETAFVVKKGGGGTATRLFGPGNIEAPLLWPASSTPPIDASLHGADLFVETDLGANDDESHLMVYDTSCASGGGPWRDMAVSAGDPCRQAD